MTDEQREQAIGRIKARRGWWWHLIIYVIINGWLIGMWFTGDQDSFWPFWVLFGWGIGVVAHGFNVFVGERPISEDQIQREIDKGS